MTKDNPLTQEKEREVELRGKKKRDFTHELKSLVDKDFNSRKGRQRHLTEIYKRRYQIRENPVFPFPGSSSIIPPLIDMEIDKQKPPLMNLLNANPIVSFIPQDAEASGRTEASEAQMQWLLTTRMRDFKDNIEMGVDFLKMNGYTIIKTMWDWQTRISTETININQFSPEEQQGLVALNAQLEQQPEFQDQFDEALSGLIIDKFGIDTEDPVDQKAFDKIFDFLTKIDDKDSITVKRNTVIYGAPYVYPVDNLFFVPQFGAKRLQDAERLTEVMFQSVNDIKMKGLDGTYEKAAVDKLMKLREEGFKDETKASSRTPTELESEKAQREGVNFSREDHPNDMEIWEIYTLYDIDDDGVKEPVVVTMQPDHEIVLKMIELPFANGKWPFVQIKNEITDDRFDSARGLPEILDQLDEEIRFNRRAKINGMMIANAPTFKYRIGSNINPNNFQWIPGQFYPVMDMNDFEPVVIPMKDASYDNEENILRNWVESRLGSVESALTRPTGLNEPRTRAEIEQVAALGQQALSISINRFQRGMKEVYDMIWDLWIQFGPEEVFVPMSGGAVHKMSKYEIAGNFDLVPTGTIGNSNPGQEAQRALTRVQTILQLKQQGAEAMSGHAFELDIGAAIIDMFNKDDIVTASKVVRTLDDEERQKRIKADQERQQRIQAAEENQPMTVQEMRRLQKEAPFSENQRIQQ